MSGIDCMLPNLQGKYTSTLQLIYTKLKSCSGVD